MEEVQAALALDEQLIAMCQVHLVDFEDVRKPEPITPETVDVKEVEARLVGEALKEIPFFKIGQRREAKKAALAQLEGVIEIEQSKNAVAAEAKQAEMDRYWAALLENEPTAVLSLLEEAFEDNQAPAAAVSCRDARVDVVMRWPGLDEMVPEKKAAVTPTGKPTLKKRTKTERAELYLEALSSNALATAKEAFAVCPGIDQVGLAVVRPSVDPVRGDRTLEALALGVLTRDQLSQINWADINATAAFLGNAEGRVGMRGKGSNKALFGLDLSDEPDAMDFLRQIATGLEARVPEEGVPGISLPIKVIVG